MPFSQESFSLFAGKSSLSWHVMRMPAAGAGAGGIALVGALGGVRLVGSLPSVGGGSLLLWVSLGGFRHL